MAGVSCQRALLVHELISFNVNTYLTQNNQLHVHAYPYTTEQTS